MKNGFGGDSEGEGVGLGNGSAIGKADKLLKIVEGRGNGDIKNAAPSGTRKYKVSRVYNIS